jgi:hypothetical protein
MEKGKFHFVPNGYVNASGRFIDEEYVLLHSILANEKNDDVACYRCAHWHGEQKHPESCDAFPRGIPKEILYCEVKHDKPYPDEKNPVDKGIRFTELID